MIGDPDPYTAIMNAVQYFHISEIVISTLPEGSSQWVADKLVDRVRGATQRPGRAHRVAARRPRRRPWPPPPPIWAHGATTIITTGRPRPIIPRASTPAFLGMLLFIISEIMIFGAFFTAYFFIRVVGGAEWPAAGDHLPKLIAGFNTAILISSSFTIHFAQESIKKNNRLGLQLGMVATFLLGLTFLFIQINEYVHIGFSPQDHAQGSIFYGLTGLHGAHVTIGLCCSRS